MSALLRAVVSKAALARRRIPTRLEFGSPARFPTDTSPSPSSETDKSGPSPSHSSYFELGMERVVSRTPGNEHLSSDQADLPRGSPVATTGQGSTPEPAHTLPSCMKIE